MYLMCEQLTNVFLYELNHKYQMQITSQCIRQLHIFHPVSYSVEYSQETPYLKRQNAPSIRVWPFFTVYLHKKW